MVALRWQSSYHSRARGRVLPLPVANLRPSLLHPSSAAPAALRHMHLYTSVGLLLQLPVPLVTSLG